MELRKEFNTENDNIVHSCLIADLPVTLHKERAVLSWISVMLSIQMIIT